MCSPPATTTTARCSPSAFCAAVRTLPAAADGRLASPQPARDRGRRLVRAAVLTQAGSLQLADLPEPECAPGEVIVEVATCGICGTDRAIFRGEAPARTPVVLGHEYSGTVRRDGRRRRRSRDRRSRRDRPQCRRRHLFLLPARGEPSLQRAHPAGDRAPRRLRRVLRGTGDQRLPPARRGLAGGRLPGRAAGLLRPWHRSGRHPTRRRRRRPRRGTDRLPAHPARTPAGGRPDPLQRAAAGASRSRARGPGPISPASRRRCPSGCGRCAARSAPTWSSRRPGSPPRRRSPSISSGAAERFCCSGSIPSTT